jgi:death-on-curing protein
MTTDTITYLSPGDLTLLAEREVGAGVHADVAALEAVSAYPGSADHGHARFPGVQVKAAALMTELLQRRPFDRGNARVALLSAIVFLNLNGLDVEASESDLAELADLAAQGTLSLMMVAAAFESITVRMVMPGDEPVDPGESG